jgi:hypothetical protein
MSDDEDDLDQFVRHALVIEAEEARRAGAVGFIARALTQATMPHKAPSDNEFTRQNGHFTLTMMSPKACRVTLRLHSALVVVVDDHGSCTYSFTSAGAWPNPVGVHGGTRLSAARWGKRRHHEIPQSNDTPFLLDSILPIR